MNGPKNVMPRHRSQRYGLALSRLLLAADALLIALPMTALIVVMGFPLFVTGIFMFDETPSFLLWVARCSVILLGILATIALWLMMVPELDNRRPAFPPGGKVDLLMHVGALVAVASLLVNSLWVLKFGAPLLIPYAHLLLHRYLRTCLETHAQGATRLAGVAR